MSTTVFAFEVGLLQPDVVPADSDPEALVPCPLHVMLVLERKVQPDRLTLGEPLKVIEALDKPWP